MMDKKRVNNGNELNGIRLTIFARKDEPSDAQSSTVQLRCFVIVWIFVAKWEIIVLRTRNRTDGKMRSQIDTKTFRLNDLSLFRFKKKKWIPPIFQRRKIDWQIKRQIEKSFFEIYWNQWEACRATLYAFCWICGETDSHLNFKPKINLDKNPTYGQMFLA